jgi:hypothetical protein
MKIVHQQTVFSRWFQKLKKHPKLGYVGDTFQWWLVIAGDEKRPNFLEISGSCGISHGLTLRIPEMWLEDPPISWMFLFCFQALQTIIIHYIPSSNNDRTKIH